MRYFLAAVLLVFITGCSQKENKLTNGKEPIYAQHLKYSKVLKVMEGEDVKLLVTATYLNSVEEKRDNGKQNFIVSVYYTLGEKKDYEFSLNESAPILKRKIEKDESLYKNIAMRNNWIDYYLYSFDDIEDIDLENRNLKLTFSDGTDSLTFSFKKE